MRSSIRLYGPSISKAITALEHVATEMPDCSIWHHEMPPELPFASPDDALFEEYIYGSGLMPAGYRTADLPTRRKVHKLISKAGNTLGDDDFMFEWHVTPTADQLRTLIAKIDEALQDTGCRYTISTR